MGRCVPSVTGVNEMRDTQWWNTLNILLFVPHKAILREVEMREVNAPYASLVAMF